MRRGVQTTVQKGDTQDEIEDLVEVTPFDISAKTPGKPGVRGAFAAALNQVMTRSQKKRKRKSAAAANATQKRNKLE